MSPVNVYHLFSSILIALHSHMQKFFGNEYYEEAEDEKPQFDDDDDDDDDEGKSGLHVIDEKISSIKHVL